VSLGEPNVALDAPVGRGGTPPDSLLDGESEFFAMEVQPSWVAPQDQTNRYESSYQLTPVCDRITFSYGGIAIDKNGHALTPDKIPIPGLLVAGVDAGGFSNLGYAGGLALAFVTGFWAARTIAQELSLTELRLPSIGAEDRDLIGVARL